MYILTTNISAQTEVHGKHIGSRKKKIQTKKKKVQKQEETKKIH